MELIKNIKITQQDYSKFLLIFTNYVCKTYGKYAITHAKEAVQEAYLAICDCENQGVPAFQYLWFKKSRQVLMDAYRRRKLEAKLFVPLLEESGDGDEDGYANYQQAQYACNDKPYASIEFADEVAKLPTNARKLAIYAMNGGQNPQNWFKENVSSSHRAYQTAKTAIRGMA